MTTVHTIYHSAGKPDDETLTRNLRGFEELYGILVALTSYVIPQEDTGHKLGVDYVVTGAFRK